jgi:hypothetical protein
MFIEEIKKPEKTLGDKFEHFGKELGELCEEAFAILEDKKMDETERKEFIDIVAAIKGAKMGTYKLMEKYSKISKSERKAIDKKADAFVAGLDKTEE